MEFGLGRPASGGDAWRPMRQVEMEEDVLHGGGERDEGDDAHVTAADGTQEREHLVDPGQELRPQHAAGLRTRRGAGETRRIRAVRRRRRGVRMIGCRGKVLSDRVPVGPGPPY